MVSYLRLLLLIACFSGFSVHIAQSEDMDLNENFDGNMQEPQTRKVSTSIQIGKMLEIDLENPEEDVINY